MPLQITLNDWKVLLRLVLVNVNVASVVSPSVAGIQLIRGRHGLKNSDFDRIHFGFSLKYYINIYKEIHTKY